MTLHPKSIQYIHPIPLLPPAHDQRHYYRSTLAYNIMAWIFSWSHYRSLAHIRKRIAPFLDCGFHDATLNHTYTPILFRLVHDNSDDSRAYLDLVQDLISSLAATLYATVSRHLDCRFHDMTLQYFTHEPLSSFASNE
jgi:hypothetical protein